MTAHRNDELVCDSSPLTLVAVGVLAALTFTFCAYRVAAAIEQFNAPAQVACAPSEGTPHE